MKALLLLSVLISLASPALARIGETREQCEARYGKPVRVLENPQTTIHQKAGLEVRCAFYEGKCDQIIFQHIERGADGKRLPLTELELKTLMEANSEGKAWEKGLEDTEFGSVIWELGDLMTASLFTRPDSSLTIATKSWFDRAKAKMNPEKKGPLKDF